MYAFAAVFFALQVAANAELGYRLTLPDGFAPFPAGRTQQDIVDCWAEVIPASPSGALVLCVQRMRGTLARGRMRREDVPASAQLRTFKWKGFDIDGFRSDTAQGGMPLVILAVQVPLRGEAVQLIVAGPLDQGQRAEAIMTSTIASLEGETNWLSASERAGRYGNIVGWVLGIAAGVILIRIWRARQRSRAA
jgi:hypothetical protein